MTAFSLVNSKVFKIIKQFLRIKIEFFTLHYVSSSYFQKLSRTCITFVFVKIVKKTTASQKFSKTKVAEQFFRNSDPVQHL